MVFETRRPDSVRVAPLLASTVSSRGAWKLTDEFLTPAQTEDFRNVLMEWRARNPHVESVTFVHFVDFAKAIGRPKAGEADQSGNLFGLLGLDPLAALDPAVRQIEQTRLLATDDLLPATSALHLNLRSNRMTIACSLARARGFLRTAIVYR